jgi:hypothetical protein
VLQIKNVPLRRSLARFAQLATAAVVSTAISTAVAAILGNSFGGAVQLTLVASVGAIGLILLGSRGRDVGALDTGTVFTFFLFAPIGRILLRQATSPSEPAVALLLGLVVAYLFGARKTQARR